MTSLPPEFDGPRLVQQSEHRAAEHLSHVCFGGIEHNALEEEPPEWTSLPQHGSTYMIAHQGAPVSMISIFHNRVKLPEGVIRLGSIGGVCTHPDYRQLGLASRLLEYCASQLTQEGACLMLISGERGLYTRVGCAFAGIFRGFVLQPRSSHPMQTRLDFRSATGTDVSIFSRLYRAEPVHFVRKAAGFTERLRHIGEYTNAEQWLVEDAGRPMGYLILGIPWEDLGRPEASVRYVREYAGNRSALAEIMEVIMAREGLQEVYWPVAWQDVELIHILQERGYPSTPVPLPEHTLRILNFPGLMADLRPCIRARLEPALRRGLHFEQTGSRLGSTQTDCYRIVHGQDCLELNGAAMTRLVMGNPGTPEITPSTAPGVLAEVIAKLFPLPSFLPGLNYQ